MQAKLVGIQMSDPQIDDVTVVGVPVPVTRTVKSLGVTTDNTLSFDDPVNNVCKAAYFDILALRHIRRRVSIDNAKTVEIAIASSRLDYCNSTLYGTSSSNINKLQRVQNALARTVMMTNKRDHITPVGPISRSSLASYYYTDSFQNRITDIQDTHYTSAELHS